MMSPDNHANLASLESPIEEEKRGLNDEKTRQLMNYVQQLMKEYSAA